MLSCRRAVMPNLVTLSLVSPPLQVCVTILPPYPLQKCPQAYPAPPVIFNPHLHISCSTQLHSAHLLPVAATPCSFPNPKPTPPPPPLGLFDNLLPPLPRLGSALSCCCLTPASGVCSRRLVSKFKKGNNSRGRNDGSSSSSREMNESENREQK